MGGQGPMALILSAREPADVADCLTSGANVVVPCRATSKYSAIRCIAHLILGVAVAARDLVDEERRNDQSRRVIDDADAVGHDGGDVTRLVGDAQPDLVRQSAGATLLCLVDPRRAGTSPRHRRGGARSGRVASNDVV